MKRALITGVTGQDGSYLAELLLEKGYEVYGMIRRSSVDYRERIAHLEGTPHFHLKFGDLGDSISLVKLIGEVKPDEIYNLAAQSHVQVSFDVPGVHGRHRCNRCIESIGRLSECVDWRRLAGSIRHLLLNCTER